MRWESNLPFKDNIQILAYDLYLDIKDIKNYIINFFKNLKNTRRDEPNNDSNDGVSDFSFEEDLIRVDPRILSDPYLYPFFKNLNKKDEWPLYDTKAYHELVSKTLLYPERQIEHTFEHYNNLVESLARLARNNTGVIDENLVSYGEILNKTNKEFDNWEKLLHLLKCVQVKHLKLQILLIKK